MFRRKNTILRVTEVTKHDKKLFHTIEVNGKDENIIECFVQLVFTLVKYRKISINDLMIAFKEGVEKGEQ